MQQQVWDRLTAEIVTVLDLEVDSTLLAANTRIRDDLGLSSLRTVDLIIRLEDTFDIAVCDDDLASLVTLGDLGELIERLLGDRA